MLAVLGRCGGHQQAMAPYPMTPARDVRQTGPGLSPSTVGNVIRALSNGGLIRGSGHDLTPPPLPRGRDFQESARVLQDSFTQRMADCLVEIAKPRASDSGYGAVADRIRDRNELGLQLMVRDQQTDRAVRRMLLQ